MSPPPDGLLHRRKGVTARPIDDGAVLVNMESGACFELNRVGFEIWELLATGASASSICETLSRRYDVDVEVLAADVRGLLEELTGQGLIDSEAPDRDAR